MKEYLAIITRVVVLISGFGIVMLNLNYAGIEGQGKISLINSGILLLSTLSAFIGGGSIVYLLPRIGVSKLIFPSIIWVLLSSFISAIILYLLDIPAFWHAIFLGVIQSIFLIQQMILLGQNRSNAYQWMLIVQSSISFIAVYTSYYYSPVPNYLSFVRGIYISFIITMIFGFILSRKSWMSTVLSQAFLNTKPLWKYGKYTQMGNIFHLSNQRSYLFFLEKSSAEGTVLAGIFSVLMYIAEALWSVAKSLSAIQGAAISQDEAHATHRKLTFRYLRVSILAAAFGLIVIVLVPRNWFEYWLHENTERIFETLYYLMPGILFNIVTIIFAHYFSGKGFHRFNAWSAAAGLVGSLVFAPILIANYSLIGAAIAASLAFGIQSAVQTWLFFRTLKKF